MASSCRFAASSSFSSCLFGLLTSSLLSSYSCLTLFSSAAYLLVFSLFLISGSLVNPRNHRRVEKQRLTRTFAFVIQFHGSSTLVLLFFHCNSLCSPSFSMCKISQSAV